MAKAGFFNIYGGYNLMKRVETIREEFSANKQKL